MMGSTAPPQPSNAFELASQIGYEFFGEIGKTAFEEFELSFASKLHFRFVDLPDFRVWQNLNLYWDKSYLKNTLIAKFSKCLPDNFAIKVTSATAETMFGSTTPNGKKLIEPVFYGKEFCLMPELMSFLGVGESMRTKIPVFNEVLEGSLTTRTLLKFGEADESLVSLYQNGVGRLYFDGKTLSYYPQTCFIVGTRPLENNVFTYLDKSGFWSRFHTVQFRIDDTAARDYFTGSMKTFDESDIRVLKTMNEDLLKCRSGSISRPSDDLLLPILQRAYETAEKLTTKFPDLDLKDVVNNRIKGDVIREISAYRILVPYASDSDVQKWAMERIPHFLDFTANPIIAEDFTARTGRTSDECLTVLRELFKGEHTRKEILEVMMNQEGFKRDVVDRTLKKFSRLGQGIYKIG